MRPAASKASQVNAQTLKTASYTLAGSESGVWKGESRQCLTVAMGWKEVQIIKGSATLFCSNWAKSQCTGSCVFHKVVGFREGKSIYSFNNLALCSQDILT